MASNETVEEAFGHGLEEASDLIVEAFELFERANACIERRDYRGFADMMHAAAKKHGAMAVLYDGLANIGYRLTLS